MYMYTKKLPELLAPAGDLLCLKAAVYAGADAVYFGCHKYNARAFAGNFDGENLDEAFRICRLFGVKIYITFNTLVTEKEFSDVLSYAASICSKYHPDGVIVQDIGLAKKLHEACGVPIVASTQMALHSALSAEFLKKLGVFRIVAAREMTLCDVKKMQEESKLEAELFIHGAICVCQSGGCLMSSLIGGRSGNRGECAQPCRLPYSGGYPLSLKDMCLAKHIPEIIDAGIASLKIEGRMKDPTYVYAVTSVYRKLLDENRPATDEEMSFLADVFSRSGFTDAYFTGKMSCDMFGVRTDKDKAKTASAQVEIPEKRLCSKLYANINASSSTLEMECGTVRVKATGDIPQAAINNPMSEEETAKRLSKTGASFFEITDAVVKIDGKLFMPMGAVNALRRNAVDMLEAAIIEKNTPIYEKSDKSDKIIVKTVRNIKASYALRFLNKDIPSPRALEEFDGDISFYDIPIWRTDILTAYADAFGQKVRAVLPRCIYPEDEADIKELINTAKLLGVGGLVCSSFAHAEAAGGMKLYADMTANATNPESVALYKNCGFESLCVSPELKSGAITAISGIMPLSAIVYGRNTLMHTRCCIVESIRAKKCPRNICAVCTETLTDRTGAKFPVIREYSHRSNIYNSVPLWLCDRKNILERCGVSELMAVFTDEDEARIKKVIRSVLDGDAPDVSITRGNL